MQLSKRPTKLSLMVASLASLSACAGMQIANIKPMVTLPYSGDCYAVAVLTHEKIRTPKQQCDEIKKRAVFIVSEDWKKQRIAIQKNCQHSQCKQLIGAFDELFLRIDGALAKIP